MTGIVLISLSRSIHMRCCFIEALLFLMVNGDHTPVTINGCTLPQL
jgi:hypothetical protein